MSHKRKLQLEEEVAGAVRIALENRQPFSLIRLGVMENLLLKKKLVRGLVKPTEILKWLKKADIIGLDRNRLGNSVLVKNVDRFGVSWTHVDINWRLYKQGKGPLVRWVKKHALLFIGRRSSHLRDRAIKLGLNVVGEFELDSPGKLEESIKYLKSCSAYELALISSDIGTQCLLAPYVAVKQRKVALDLGLVLDDMLENWNG